MNKQKNLEKLLFKTFDEDIKGADIYNHNGSMWLIFTEKRKWVVEFTKQKTLWYNYKHFNDILVLFGMELSEGDEYIKKWYEERFLFKPKIVDDSIKDRIFFVEDTIDNGVKNVDWMWNRPTGKIADAIKNGVKDIRHDHKPLQPLVDVTIQNGVKDIDKSHSNYRLCVEDTIQNGVKNSQSFDGESLKLVEDAIQNGVKHTEDGDWLDGDERFEDIIKDGVKHTLSCKIRSSGVVEYAIQNGVKNGVKEVYSQIIRPYLVDDVLKDGVKYMMSGSEFKNNQVEDIIKYSVKS